MTTRRTCPTFDFKVKGICVMTAAWPTSSELAMTSNSWRPYSFSAEIITALESRTTWHGHANNRQRHFHKLVLWRSRVFTCDWRVKPELHASLCWCCLVVLSTRLSWSNRGCVLYVVCSAVLIRHVYYRRADAVRILPYSQATASIAIFVDHVWTRVPMHGCG